MNLKVVQLIISVLFVFSLGGCKSLFKLPIDANTAYETKQYAVAAELLAKEYETTTERPKKGELAYKIGECYRLFNRPDLAESWYERATERSADPMAIFRYGQMLKSNAKYSDAIKIFTEYSLANPSDRTRATREIQACKQALTWQSQSKNYKIINLKDLNSAASDFSPILYKDRQLVFTSSRNEATGAKNYGWTGEKHTDLFVALRNKDELRFSDISLFGDSINTRFNEGTAAFSPDFSRIYFTACGSDNPQDDYCQIYVARRNSSDTGWQMPELLDLFPDTKEPVNYGQPALSPDGSQLYFSADAPGGYGNKDIYVTTLARDGFWEMPENLGPEINTDGYEGFPHIGVDGKLYFASDGHIGMGGLDLFAATKKGKQWTDPQNLQAPINSSADDFGIYLDPAIAPALLDSIARLGYFCSSRKGGLGNDDIYRLVEEIPKAPPIKDTTTVVAVVPKPQPPKKVVVLQATVLQKVLENPNNPNSRELGRNPIPSAVVEVLGVSANSSLSKRLVADATGKTRVVVEENAEYKVTGAASGFFRQSANVSTHNRVWNGDTSVVYVELLLDKIFKQQEVKLENIYYDLDKADIRDDAKPTLDKLATLLFENPNIKIELGSHTDSRGSDKYNLTLSQQRAQSVVNYLAAKGIATDRAIARGYGETQLVNECTNGANCTEEQHQQNRRTTFKVIADNYTGN